MVQADRTMKGELKLSCNCGVAGPCASGRAGRSAGIGKLDRRGP